MFELWKVSDLDTARAQVGFCCHMADPLDAHKIAEQWGPGDYQVWTPDGHPVRNFTITLVMAMTKETAFNSETTKRKKKTKRKLAHVA